MKTHSLIDQIKIMPSVRVESETKFGHTFATNVEKDDLIREILYLSQGKMHIESGLRIVGNVVKSEK